MSRFLHLLLFVTLCSSPLIAQKQSWEKTREIAAKRHEIVELLIKKKEYGKVMDAADKLFNLEFPPENEHLKVTSAERFCDVLIDHNHLQLAHSVLDLALERVRQSQNLAELYKYKAYLYKKEGHHDEAMECFEKSLELEGSN